MHLPPDDIAEAPTARQSAALGFAAQGADVFSTIQPRFPDREQFISGRLKVAAAGEDGKQTLLRIMDPGEVIGEISLLDSQPRSGTVTALDPAELLVIQRRDLIPFLEQHPKTAIKLLRALAERLRSISVQLEDRVFLNLPPRLAKKLLALSETYGQPVARGVRIDLKLKQGELGEMVRTSRESINKHGNAGQRLRGEHGRAQQRNGCAAHDDGPCRVRS